jgi:hypothetical protein
MVQSVENKVFYQNLYQSKVCQHTGARVNVATQLYFQSVIVTVKVFTIP